MRRAIIKSIRRPVRSPACRTRRLSMFGALAKKIFGSVNDRRLKSYRPKVAAINALEAELEALSDDELRARTEDFKARAGARARASTTSSSRPSPRCARRPSAPWASGISTCSSSAAWCCTRAPSPRCGPAKARRSSRRCRSTSTPLPARAFTSSRSTTISPVATPSGWARSTVPRPVGRRHRARARRRRSARQPMRATSPTAPTTSTASTICATT